MDKEIETKVYEKCVWKAMGNLERIRMRESKGLFKPHPNDDICEYHCCGNGVIIYRENNSTEFCSYYLPNRIDKRRDLGV